MLFDLKNTGVTSQQIMNKVFNNQIGQNIEAYIDSMLVKNMNFKKYLQDLKEVFSLLHQYQIKLNPTKYAFVINGGKFLSFLVRTKEIEPNPKKIQVIMNMTNF
jgi:pyruvate carboxylase